MWWLYPQAVYYALIATTTYKVIKDVITYVRHVPERLHDFVDDFNWSRAKNAPTRFLSRVKWEKSRLEEEYIKKSNVCD